MLLSETSTIIKETDLSAPDKNECGHQEDETIQSHNFSDPVCGLCMSGGELLCCDGPCLRSFHPKCLGLSNVELDRIMLADSPFVCSDCFIGVQRCFVCSEFDIEDEMIKCSVEFCGKFYHEACLSKNNALISSQETSINVNKSFICQLHQCDTCGDSQILQIKKRSLMWRCFRCPKAFDLKHRPRDVHVLSEGIFLCIKHTIEEESWPVLQDELLFRLEKKKEENARKEREIEKSKKLNRMAMNQMIQTKSSIKYLEDEVIVDKSNSDLMIPRLGVAKAAMRDGASSQQRKQLHLGEHVDDSMSSATSNITSSFVIPRKPVPPPAAATTVSSNINISENNISELVRTSSATSNSSRDSAKEESTRHYPQMWKRARKVYTSSNVSGGSGGGGGRSREPLQEPQNSVPLSVSDKSDISDTSSSSNVPKLNRTSALLSSLMSMPPRIPVAAASDFSSDYSSSYQDDDSGTYDHPFHYQYQYQYTHFHEHHEDNYEHRFQYPRQYAPYYFKPRHNNQKILVGDREPNQKSSLLLATSVPQVVSVTSDQQAQSTSVPPILSRTASLLSGLKSSNSSPTTARRAVYLHRQISEPQQTSITSTISQSHVASITATMPALPILTRTASLLSSSSGKCAAATNPSSTEEGKVNSDLQVNSLITCSNINVNTDQMDSNVPVLSTSNKRTISLISQSASPPSQPSKEDDIILIQGSHQTVNTTTSQDIRSNSDSINITNKSSPVALSLTTVFVESTNKSTPAATINVNALANATETNFFDNNDVSTSSSRVANNDNLIGGAICTAPPKSAVLSRTELLLKRIPQPASVTVPTTTTIAPPPPPPLVSPSSFVHSSQQKDQDTNRYYQFSQAGNSNAHQSVPQTSEQDKRNIIPTTSYFPHNTAVLGGHQQLQQYTTHCAKPMSFINNNNNNNRNKNLKTAASVTTSLPRHSHVGEAPVAQYPPPAPPAKSAPGKMNAADLLAMLKANGMLPSSSNK